MDTVKRLFIEWYWGQVQDILITLIVSIAVGISLQIIKYCIGYFVMTPEQAEIIVYKVFDIFSIASGFSVLMTLVTMFIKLIPRIVDGIRDTFSGS